MTLDPAISLLCSLSAALLFGWSALHKWRTRAQFVATVEEYQLAPAQLAPALAAALLLAESVLCLMALMPQLQSLAAACGAALLLIYAGAMSLNLARGRRDLDCGCGVTRRSIGWGLVLRNVALAAWIAIPVLQQAGRPLSAGDYATVTAALLALVLLYAAAEQLLVRPDLS